MPFHIFTGAFPEGSWIPPLHSCEGADLSPALEWTGLPAETRSLALVVEDPDAPGGVFAHWLLYDINPKITALPQGVRTGALGLGGTNDFDTRGYKGPCPPRGGPHRYLFRLYALDVHTLGLPAGVKRAELLQAMKGHILGETQYMGRFARK
ncbi:MAG TPA: YbhB/YbcL family Raf kinase inhibitor-like protein [Bryobacteraceae bacterium]|nr:YbhB/YbcL family Raf kinase inhibitor-like protein [Bryobacteraceae bacterium]